MAVRGQTFGWLADEQAQLYEREGRAGCPAPVGREAGARRGSPYQGNIGAFWERWLSRRKPYLESGTWQAYERDGRLRLIPALESTELGRLDVEHIRGLMDEWVEAMEAEELAPKTINNTLGTLVVCRTRPSRTA